MRVSTRQTNHHLLLYKQTAIRHKIIREAINTTNQTCFPRTNTCISKQGTFAENPSVIKTDSITIDTKTLTFDKCALYVMNDDYEQLSQSVNSCTGQQ